MPLRLISSKRIVGGKIESTPYTAETLAVGDFDFGAYDISYNIEVEEYDRKLSRGDYSHDTGVSGKRLLVVSFKHDLARGATAATAPKYAKFLKACCMKELAGASGIRWTTDSTQNRVPVTMEVREIQEGAAPKHLSLKGKGMMGTVRPVMSQVGAPVALEFELRGPLVSVSTIAAASAIMPTGFDTTRPAAVLSATVSMFATTHCIGSFTIDLGNQVEVFTCPSDPSGYEGARVVSRDATMETDPDMLVTDDINWYNSHINNTTGAVTITLSDGIVMFAPAAQLLQTYNPGDREGHVTDSIRMRLCRVLGNDEFYIQQGTV